MLISCNISCSSIIYGCVKCKVKILSICTRCNNNNIYICTLTRKHLCKQTYNGVLVGASRMRVWCIECTLAMSFDMKEARPQPFELVRLVPITQRSAGGMNALIFWCGNYVHAANVPLQNNILNNDDGYGAVVGPTLDRFDWCSCCVTDWMSVLNKRMSLWGVESVSSKSKKVVEGWVAMAKRQVAVNERKQLICK